MNFSEEDANHASGLVPRCVGWMFGESRLTMFGESPLTMRIRGERRFESSRPHYYWTADLTELARCSRLGEGHKGRPGG